MGKNGSHSTIMGVHVLITGVNATSKRNYPVLSISDVLSRESK